MFEEQAGSRREVISHAALDPDQAAGKSTEQDPGIAPSLPPMDGIDAVVLAGGLASRLRPVLGATSKSMVPVNGRPFLEYLLLHLKRHGVRRAMLCIGYRGNTIEQYFAFGDK